MAFLLALPGCLLDWTPPLSGDGGASDGRRDTVTRDVGAELFAAVEALCVECGDGRSGDGPSDGTAVDAADDGAWRLDATQGPLVLTTTSLPNATAGAAYTFALSTTGGK